MKKLICLFAVLLALQALPGLAAYHHQGEDDSAVFLGVYPETVGTKLDHCATCHSGGSYVDSRGRTVNMGSCQWCHYSYGYDASGDIATTLNGYGQAYLANGRNAAAVTAIAAEDSDGDTYSNAAEIAALRYPGSAADDPTKVPAPSRVYTRAQLEALGQHTQFLLMNTSRSGDSYAQYTGVPMETLLTDAGITEAATGIVVYAPDGFATNHPLDPAEDPNLYHVRGTYPQSTFHFDAAADASAGGWCDYSAPSVTGRTNGDLIPDEMRLILAYKREGVYLNTGILTDQNRLDGEGPFRVVPPQKVPSPPDQSSTAANQNVVWPYDNSWDHNAGFSSRSATMIKVEPLPEGTTDIDILEAGWNYVDTDRIVVYGAIDGGTVEPPPAAVTDSDSGSNSGCFLRALLQEAGLR